jgi:hypothetical protein
MTHAVRFGAGNELQAVVGEFTLAARHRADDA